jgi:hypothetical protein
MDKQLLKAYIRTIVEEEVERILPKMLAEAVNEVKQLTEIKTSVAAPIKKPSLDRKRFAELMDISYDGNTLRAATNNMTVPLPENTPHDADPEVIKAVTKDYSAIMKKLGLS